MPKTTIVNVRHEKCDIYIGRAGQHGERDMDNTPVGVRGWLGNPFALKDHQNDADKCLSLFAGVFLKRLENDPDFRAAVLALRGKKLGCWCKPGPCHGDVIAKWIDSQEAPNENI